MAFYSIVLLCFSFILFHAVEFTSTVSYGSDSFKLTRYIFNETLPCNIPQAESFSPREVTWTVTNDTVTSFQLWPFDFENNVIWREFDIGRDNSLIIKRSRLHHGGMYTCQIGANTANVEVVIFRASCSFGTEGTNEKLDCGIEHRGPTTPNVTWLSGNGKEMQGKTYRTPSTTQVISTARTSNGPFECRVSDSRLNRAKTACYRGGRITDKATTRVTYKSTKPVTRPLSSSTTQATTATSTEPSTMTISTTARSPEETSTLSIDTTTTTTVVVTPVRLSTEVTTVRPTTAADPAYILVSSLVVTTADTADIQTQATRVQNVTTGGRFAETEHQVHNSTVTTVTPDADSLMWIIIASFLVFIVLVAIIIALLLIRFRKQQKHQDYMVEKAKEPLSSEVPLGLRYEKEENEKNEAHRPMLIKKVMQDNPV